MRVVFMGTPAFAVPALTALLASSHEIVAVYSQPPRPAGRGMKLMASPVQQLAEKHQAPVFTPTSLKTPDVQEAFRAHQADIAVVAAYGLLLPQVILDAPKHGCINIHPSDLSRWRGAAPIQRTLMAGDTQTASCIIRLEAGLDTGPIYLRESFSIPPEMNAGMLHDAMAEIGARQVLALLDQLQNTGSLPTPTPQSAAGITYAQKLEKAEYALDWTKPAHQLLNQIRGLSPTPGAIFWLNGEVFKVFSAAVEAGNARLSAGIALDDQLLINCGDGQALRLIELQRPGRSRQPASQFLAGMAVAAGSALVDKSIPNP